MPVVDDNENIEEKEQIVDLEKVHEHTINEIDAENVNEDENEEETGDSNEENTSEEDEKNEENGENEDSEGEEENEEEDEPDAPAPPAPPVEEPQVDTDITKNANGKIAVKNSDGDTFYFNNLDEVPDDFEPETYKAWGVAVQRFAEKAQSDRQAEREKQILAEKERQQNEINEVTARWDKEINSLVKDGTLPKDEKEREILVGDTYKYMANKLADGTPIDSFAEAHKARMYEELKAKERKEKDELKKAKGSKVMGGAGSSPGTKKEPTPLPAGTSLDAVHARFSGLI